jgi:hypothetical protein
MRAILLAVCACLLGCSSRGVAAEALTGDAVADFRQAFAESDLATKRQATRELTASQLPDAVVLPLLVSRVGDRQAYADVIDALRRRTGLRPPVYVGQSHYPDYPPSDHPLSWQYWLEDWRREHAQDQRIDTALAHAREADVAASRALSDAENATR